MIDKKLVQLVSRLHGMTIENRVTWELSAHPENFQVSFPSYIIQIARSRNTSSYTIDWEYNLKIFNSSNELIDEVSDAELESVIPNSYRMMDDLYTNARRSAMKVDEAIDYLLSELGEDEGSSKNDT